MAMSGETTTIDSARTYLTELGGHVETEIESQLELCHTTLSSAEMDEHTLGLLTQASEQFAVARATVAEALSSLNSRHSLMEEAVNATGDDAATRDFYRHQ